MALSGLREIFEFRGADVDAVFEPARGWASVSWAWMMDERERTGTEIVGPLFDAMDRADAVSEYDGHVREYYWWTVMAIWLFTPEAERPPIAEIFAMVKARAATCS